jgi:hypothetical protein
MSVKILKALWQNSSPAAFFFFYHYFELTPPTFCEIKAKEAVTGYFQGRAIKTDLSGDTANPLLYDRDWGQGSFQRAVNSIN